MLRRDKLAGLNSERFESRGWNSYNYRLFTNDCYIIGQYEQRLGTLMIARSHNLDTTKIKVPLGFNRKDLRVVVDVITVHSAIKAKIG